MRRRALQLGFAVLTSVVVLVVALVGSATSQQRGVDPERVISKSDPATAKLDDALQAKVSDGATGQVPVLVATSGDTTPVKALLDGDASAVVTLHVAFNKAMTAGQDYFGELLLGPSAAPTALTVPVKISRTP